MSREGSPCSEISEKNPLERGGFKMHVWFRLELCTNVEVRAAFTILQNGRCLIH
jgi:hypothetical protein